jgi:hypothetical protein
MKHAYTFAFAAMSVYAFIVRCFVALGASAMLMLMLGYAYASVPLILPKTCTPSFIDRILK